MEEYAGIASMLQIYYRYGKSSVEWGKKVLIKAIPLNLSKM